MSLTMVEYAIKVLEDDEHFNAGHFFLGFLILALDRLNTKPLFACASPFNICRSRIQSDDRRDS